MKLRCRGTGRRRRASAGDGRCGLSRVPLRAPVDRLAVDPQDLRGPHLVAAGVLEHLIDVALLELAQGEVLRDGVSQQDCGYALYPAHLPLVIWVNILGLNTTGIDGCGSQIICAPSTEVRRGRRHSLRVLGVSYEHHRRQFPHSYPFLRHLISGAGSEYFARRSFLFHQSVLFHVR